MLVVAKQETAAQAGPEICVRRPVFASSAGFVATVRTWLSSEVSEQVRRARYAFLACLVGGLMQKPLIKFAWDMQNFQTELRRVHKRLRTRGDGEAVLGGTAILLRQVFAAKGQSVVADIAVSLAVAGKNWDSAALRHLSRELGELDAADAGKRKGRMSAFSGPRWIRRVLAGGGPQKRFQAASQMVGRFLCAEELEPAAFHGLCESLKKPAAKLPGVGEYSVPHIVRACCIARAFIRGDGAENVVQPDADAWAKDLRVMHRDRTKAVFDLIGVTYFDDALALLGTMLDLARRTWSASVARHWASISLVDLPCAACEFGGVLGAVCSIHGGGDAQAVRWLLRHLPGQLTKLKKMGRLLKQGTARLSSKGNGLDHQCSGFVARGWLKQHPDEPAVDMTSVLTRGGGDQLFRLPAIVCAVCGGTMQPRLSGRKRKLCSECYRARVRRADAQRQARRRRLLLRK